MINLAIPVDFDRSFLWGLRNLYRISVAAKDSANIYFSINTRNYIKTSIIEKTLKKINKNINIIDCPYTGKVNRSKLRNEILKHVKNDILFLDADIRFPETKAFSYIKERRKNFIMFPCLYERKNSSKKKGYPSSVGILRKKYLHIAIPSSIIYCRNCNLLFDEKYVGHGYEDFDFIIRYLIKEKLIDKTSDLLVDIPYESVFQLKGLRLVLSSFALETLKEGIFLEHIYHPKGDKCVYREERSINRNRYQEKFKEFNRCPEFSKSFFDILREKRIDLNDPISRLLFI